MSPLPAAIKEALLAADRIDSRSTLADDGEGYWVSLREMKVLRTALAHRSVKRVLDDYAPSLLKPRPKRRSGLKRDSKDAAWSKMVRERASLRCQFVEPIYSKETERNDGHQWMATTRCHQEVGRGLAPQGLHAAHCFTRGNPRTRLDPDNGLAMCWPHHRAIDADKSLKFFVFRYWLGPDGFDALQAKANAKRDRS